MKPKTQSSSPPLNTPNYRIISTSKIYKDVNSHISPDDNFFENFQIEYGDIEKYEVISPIGSGKYSLVFSGRCRDSGEYCAVKILKNIPFIKIKKEICLLKMVAKIPNCVRLYSVVKDPLTGFISIVTDYLNNENPRNLYPNLSIDDIRVLIYKLLHSINECAKIGIMHRDIKPGNLLISDDHRDLKLIDWGLGDLYFPGKPYTVRVSTMRYKAPELLMNYQYYDYGVDVWGVGCVLAEMLVKFPFFEGRNIDEMIIEIAKICGSSSILQYIDKYGLEVQQSTLSKLPNNNNSCWQRVINMIKPKKMDKDAVDLLKKLLKVDHEDRITAAKALTHPFFDPIRKNINKN